MTEWKLTLYNLLPGPARSVAASLKGYQLRSRRYGPETARWIEEALERESWSSEQWNAWREARLGALLHRAATRVPYYRAFWERRRREGMNASWEHLENWPILEKETLRRNAAGFVADDVPLRTLYPDHTSGTTGKPLDLWMSRSTLRMWYALFEARWRKWYGVSMNDRWANVGGQLVAPVGKRTPPFWVWNAPLNQLYMSSYHLSPDLIPVYVAALQRYRIRYMFGYSSSLYAIASELLKRPVPGLRIEVVVTNAEPLFAHQREVIEEGFRCPVRETYGMSEMVAAASQCERGSLHLWPEAGITEIMDAGRPVPAGTTGEVVCTGLLNEDMPLIRYRVGDRASLRPQDTLCGCGRGLPVLESVEGRSDDTLYTVDGRRIGRLDTVFKEHLPIREAQIIQESLRRVRVKIVPDGILRPEDGTTLIRRLRDRMGMIEVVLEEVAEIPRSANGKFRAVQCALPPEEREHLEGARRASGGSVAVPRPPMIGKISIKRVLKRSAGYAATAGLYLSARRTERAACIFNYHRVTTLPFVDRQRDDWNVDPHAFERQVAELAERTEIIPLTDLPSRLSLDGPVDRPLVSLTFDDGYENFFTDALPVLKRYGVPATLFVVTRYVGAHEPFPFDAWSNANKGTAPVESWRPINWHQLEQCMQTSLITVGAHSHCHRNGLESSPALLEEETQRSRAILHERLGPAAGNVYSYPYGSRRLGQVSDAYVAAVRAAGYRIAVTTDLGLARPGADPLALPRVEAHALDTPAVMRAKAFGVLAPYRITDWLRQAYREPHDLYGHS